MNPVALLRRVSDNGDEYDAIVLWCPGCERIDPVDDERHGGLHMLPVSGDATKRPVWGWNLDLVNVTLTPSILTKHGEGDEFVCHSYLTNGQWRFLSDCTHPLKDQTVPMVELPSWAVD